MKSGTIYRWGFLVVMLVIGLLVGLVIVHTTPTDLTNDEVLELYFSNETEISALWIDMADRGINASMRDAVEEWQRTKGD